MKTNIHFFIMPHSVDLRVETFQIKFVEKFKTHSQFTNFFFPKIVPFMRRYEEILWSRTGHR
jgi:hypothetical protein